eukprot:4622487-Prymnesium_polylepis.1
MHGRVCGYELKLRFFFAHAEALPARHGSVADSEQAFRPKVSKAPSPLGPRRCHIRASGMT